MSEKFVVRRGGGYLTATNGMGVFSATDADDLRVLVFDYRGAARAICDIAACDARIVAAPLRLSDEECWAWLHSLGMSSRVPVVRPKDNGQPGWLCSVSAGVGHGDTPCNAIRAAWRLEVK